MIDVGGKKTVILTVLGSLIVVDVGGALRRLGGLFFHLLKKYEKI